MKRDGLWYCSECYPHKPDEDEDSYERGTESEDSFNFSYESESGCSDCED